MQKIVHYYHKFTDMPPTYENYMMIRDWCYNNFSGYHIVEFNKRSSCIIIWMELSEDNLLLVLTW